MKRFVLDRRTFFSSWKILKHIFGFLRIKTVRITFLVDFEPKLNTMDMDMDKDMNTGTDRDTTWTGSIHVQYRTSDMDMNTGENMVTGHEHEHRHCDSRSLIDNCKYNKPIMANRLIF
jgi:hypothetical protein